MAFHQGTTTATIKPSARATTTTTSRSSSSPKKKTGFKPTEMKEVHMIRHRKILEKYPQIKELYGPDIRLFPAVMGIIAAQFALSYYASTLENFWHWLFLCWSGGGLFTHWLSLANHELSHNLCFKKPIYNTALGITANLAQGAPSFVAFKKYHSDHHYYLNDEFKDPDCPTRWEAEFFNTTVKKAGWMFFNVYFYIFRPLIMIPKPPSALEIFNLFFVFAFDALVIVTFKNGSIMVLFNILSTWMGMGIHPIAGHFISEHYDLYNDDNGQETYSYYGPLNYVAFNVGYHVEHHDFPRVPGFRLPQVTKIAPEFYENLNPRMSWTKVVYDYITHPDIGPFRRIIRKRTEKDGEGPKQKHS